MIKIPEDIIKIESFKNVLEMLDLFYANKILNMKMSGTYIPPNTK